MPQKNVQRWQVYAQRFASYRASPGDTIDPVNPPDEATVPRLDLRQSIGSYNHLWVLVKGGAGANISVWVEYEGEWYLFETQAVTLANECLMFEGIPAELIAVTSDASCDLIVTKTE